MSTIANIREPRRRRTLITVCVVGILLVVLGLAGAGGWAVLRRADRVYAQVAELEASIRERGQPVTIEELNAYYPAVPNEENAALVYEEAFRLLESIDPDGERTADLLEQLNGVSRVAPSGLVEEVEAHLESCEVVFEVLARAAEYPASRYPVDFRRGVATDISHLAPLRDCARLAALWGSFAVRNGRNGEFVESQRSTLSIARSLRYEPAIISQMVRIAILAIAVDQLAHSIGLTQLSEEALSELRYLYEGAEDPETMVRAYVGERCGMGDMVYRMRMGEFDDRWPASYQPSIDSFRQSSYPKGNKLTANRERLAVFEHLTPFALASAMTWPERVALSAQKHASLKDFPSANAAASIFLPGLARGVVSFGREAALLRMAQVALALETFRAGTGQIPAELGELVPETLSKLILDPFDGQPIRYRSVGNGYIVYSVYADLEDDGGIQATNSDSGEWLGDWVFEVRR